MGDVGDFWRDVRDHRREQKRKQEPLNELLIRELRTLASVVEMGPSGPHLRVNGAVDFWPSTGRKISLPGADGISVGMAKRAIKEARTRALTAMEKGQ